MVILMTKNKQELSGKDYTLIFTLFKEPEYNDEDKDVSAEWQKWWGIVLNVASRLGIDDRFNTSDPMAEDGFAREVRKFANRMIWFSKNYDDLQTTHYKEAWIDATKYIKYGGENLWILEQ